MSAGQVRSLTMEGRPDVPESLPAIPLLGQVEILAVRQGGLVECYVPTQLIDHEEVPVKEEWAASLAKQMREKAESEGGSGQQTPIQIGYIDGESQFKIIDGFHRDAALLRNEEARIFSTAKRTDWNTLYDDRIFTAKDHAHVRFSRVVQWIREVWRYSNLDDQMSVEQAVLLYRFDTDGSKLGLDPEAVDAAKVWVQRKESQWQMAAMTIHSHLKVAENVDPKLVHSTREKRSGHALEAPTQTILKNLSEILPGEKNFELQNLVVDTAIQHNLQSPQFKALCLSVLGKSIDEASDFTAKIDWNNWQPEFSRTKKQQLRRAHDPRHNGAQVLNNAAVSIEHVLARVAQTRERREPVTEEMKIKLGQTVKRIKEMQSSLDILSVQLEELGAMEPLLLPENTPSSIGQLAVSETFLGEAPESEEDIEQPQRSDYTETTYINDVTAKNDGEPISVDEDVEHDVSRVASEVGLSQSDLLENDDLVSDEEDSFEEEYNGIDYITENLRSLDAGLRSKPERPRKVSSENDLEMPIDFKINGKRFSRDSMRVGTFGKIDETLRVLIAIGMANDNRYSYLQDDIKRKYNFILRITNKGVDPNEALEHKQLMAKLRRLKKKGYVVGQRQDVRLTSQGFTKVFEDTPRVAINGKIIKPRKI